MVSYLLNDCNDCGSVFKAIDSIDVILAKYAKNKYDNELYLTRKPFPKHKIKLLARYKDILEDLTWTSDFYLPHFSTSTILSRVGAITSGL
jgi:hypothetical protein